MQKTAVAIRHVDFEDLGLFEDVLTQKGYKVQYCDLGIDNLLTLDTLQPEILIVLGGPVGVYETDAYPFLLEERRILKARLARDRPTFGICLGAQQIAAALGASVGPTGVREIGFSMLSLTEEGRKGPLHCLDGVPVLHWHGDAFSTPEGGRNLATTSLCATQAFALGHNILGVQFHPEVDTAVGFERWLVGHAHELAASGTDPRRLRDAAATIGPSVRDSARHMFAEWLNGIRL